MTIALASRDVLLEVLEQEARELAGLLSVDQLVEEQVAAVGVLEGKGPVELAVDSVEERLVAVPAPRYVVVLEADQLFGPWGPGPEAGECGAVKPVEQLLR